MKGKSLEFKIIKEFRQVLCFGYINSKCYDDYMKKEIYIRYVVPNSFYNYSMSGIFNLVKKYPDEIEVKVGGERDFSFCIDCTEGHIEYKFEISLKFADF